MPSNEKYDAVSKKIQEAGFFVTPVESMGDWDRISIAAKRSAQGGYTGNSFWLTNLAGVWYLGLWSERFYRIPDEGKAGDLCIELFSHNPHQITSELDSSTQVRFDLLQISDDEFDALAGHTLDVWDRERAYDERKMHEQE